MHVMLGCIIDQLELRTMCNAWGPMTPAGQLDNSAVLLSSTTTTVWGTLLSRPLDVTVSCLRWPTIARHCVHSDYNSCDVGILIFLSRYIHAYANDLS
jgi:hypothetical protein